MLLALLRAACKQMIISASKNASGLYEFFDDLSA